MEGAINLLGYPELAGDAGRLLPYIWEPGNVKKLTEQAGTRSAPPSSSGRKTGARSCRTVRWWSPPSPSASQGAGSIGIIGPIRMDYAAMQAETEYFARLLGELLTEIFEE